jgi:UDP-N-acetylmuramoyl-L-alanyl-D-glutamate--2,6-diaminopimelate ligase
LTRSRRKFDKFWISNHHQRKVENALRLSELINGDRAACDPALSELAAAGALDLDIQGVTSDSRAVRPGFLFAALPGSATDGRRFIPEAVARGAVAVLTPSGDDAISIEGVCSIPDRNPRHRLARMAAKFYGAQPAFIVAVTGTNGKTSVAEFARQLWAATGSKSASLGTLGLIADGTRSGPGLTTPDPVALHAILRDLANDGVEHLAMEASSHGLDQCRLDGIRARAAAFTNLSQDHLDYHGDMGAYLDAKLRLFSDLLVEGGAAVLNRDIPEFERIAGVCKARGISVTGFGVSEGADLRLLHQAPTSRGQELALRLDGTEHRVFLPLVGDFQAMNALAALGLVARAEGRPVADFLEALAELSGVPGRLQLVGRHGSGAPVYVDYAHTPDALKTLLEAARPHVEGRLICVFGAGGDRDTAKRPLMGAAVSEGADLGIVTDDNPRTDDPAAIRRAVLAGCPEALEIGDRASAIAAGIKELGPKDMLLIAGKGHEVGQSVGDTVLPFDDAEVARGFLLSSGGRVS